jgi:hypothetical protein
MPLKPIHTQSKDPASAWRFIYDLSFRLMMTGKAKPKNDTSVPKREEKAETNNQQAGKNKSVSTLRELSMIDTSREQFTYDDMVEFGIWPDQCLEFLQVNQSSYLEFSSVYGEISDMFDFVLRKAVSQMKHLIDVMEKGTLMREGDGPAHEEKGPAHEEKGPAQKEKEPAQKEKEPAQKEKEPAHEEKESNSRPLFPAIREYLQSPDQEIESNYWEHLCGEDNCYMQELEDHVRSPKENHHYLLIKAVREYLAALYDDNVSSDRVKMRSSNDFSLIIYNAMFDLRQAHCLVDDLPRRALIAVLNKNDETRVEIMFEAVFQGMIQELQTHLDRMEHFGRELESKDKEDAEDVEGIAQISKDDETPIKVTRKTRKHIRATSATSPESHISSSLLSNSDTSFRISKEIPDLQFGISKEIPDLRFGLNSISSPDVVSSTAPSSTNTAPTNSFAHPSRSRSRSATPVPRFVRVDLVSSRGGKGEREKDEEITSDVINFPTLPTLPKLPHTPISISTSTMPEKSSPSSKTSFTVSPDIGHTIPSIFASSNPAVVPVPAPAPINKKESEARNSDSRPSGNGSGSASRLRTRSRSRSMCTPSTASLGKGSTSMRKRFNPAGIIDRINILIDLLEYYTDTSHRFLNAMVGPEVNIRFFSLTPNRMRPNTNANPSFSKSGSDSNKSIPLRKITSPSSSHVTTRSRLLSRNLTMQHNGPGGYGGSSLSQVILPSESDLNDTYFPWLTTSRRIQVTYVYNYFLHLYRQRQRKADMIEKHSFRDFDANSSASLRLRRGASRGTGDSTSNSFETRRQNEDVDMGYWSPHYIKTGKSYSLSPLLQSQGTHPWSTTTPIRKS